MSRLPLWFLEQVYEPGKFLDPSNLPFPAEPLGDTDVMAVYRGTSEAVMRAVRARRQAARDDFASLLAPYGLQPTSQAAARCWPGTRRSPVERGEAVMASVMMQQEALPVPASLAPGDTVTMTATFTERQG